LETVNGNKDGAYRFQYAFGEFEIDPVERTCTRLGTPVPLTAKAFDVLLAFVENPNRLLGKDELMERVWHDEFVEEGNLARNVSTLRKALGDTGKEHKYIKTIQGRGYRFVGDVSRNGPDATADSTYGTAAQIEEPEKPSEKRKQSRRWILAIAVVAILLTVAWVGTERYLTPSQQIRTIAILPLKRLDGGDNYLGIGIADAVIRRISQSRQLTIRPTSSILRYANSDVDTLAAARELNTDAVLEGNVQSSGDRLRVSVNLLRTSDGTSIWADNFDMPAADIFAIQDRVAQQVAAKLELHTDNVQTAGVPGKFPANSAAYEYYIKGIFSLDQRGSEEEAMPQMQTTIDLLKKSIEADPNYALAHAQLAWAYVWTSQLIEPANPKWADNARQEMVLADQLDPNLAETHQARAMLAWSKWGNFEYDVAIRELRIAQQLNPSTNHGEVVGIIGHLGLEEESARELSKALEIDPTSRSLKDLTTILPFLRGDADAWLASRQSKPRNYVLFEPWYYLRKGDLDTAKRAIDERMPKGQEYPDFLMIQALYLALKGEHQDAASRIPAILSKVDEYDLQRHHITYHAACVYALAGDSGDAVRWLSETAATGFPNYPLFARDPFLDRIRQSPEFIQFLGEQKAQWERFKQEFLGE
jgi:DNA-binding winged helix-turn-helix (wHTH) protein/TolB-like protein